MENKKKADPNPIMSKIRSDGLLSINNRPPIKSRIFYMFKRKRIHLSPEEEIIIEIINEIRNQLYHEEHYLSRLLGILSRKKKFKLNNPNLRTIALFEQKFSLIVEKLILRFFKIIPNYYQLIEREYYHNLENRVINLLDFKTDQITTVSTIVITIVATIVI